MSLTDFPRQVIDIAPSFKLPPTDNQWWQDTLFVPVLFVAASALLLANHLVFRNHIGDQNRFQQEENGFLARHGGSVVLGFRVTRFAACIALFGIQLYQLLDDVVANTGGKPLDDLLREYRYRQLALVFTYWYISVLSLLATGNGRWGSLTRKHSVAILLVVAGVYGYRDVLPWMTYTLKPMDEDEGQLLYFKLMLLTIAAIIVPLFIPRIYIPLDPKDPMEVPSAEQTASIFSLSIYAFLDPIILEAAKVPHLAFDRLPPLIDREQASHLKAISFSHLDQFRAKRQRHLFWGLMLVFSQEYATMIVCIFLYAGFRFVPPLALNRILDYIETGDAPGRIVTPWFWVASLFFGPAVGSIVGQWYLFLSTHVFAKAQAILTQLIFEHSLRIRLKAETRTSGSSQPTANTKRAELSVPPIPDCASGSTANTTAIEEPDDGQPTSTSGAKGNTKGETNEETRTPRALMKEENLVGTINTLVTVDVDNVLEGKDFLMLAILVPTELTLSAIFLYKILGWSAFVGIASIIVMIPVPGYFASVIQNLNRQKMTRTDARVQAVTETISVLRMVKLFGREKKMIEFLEEKREEELVWIWKNKVITVANAVINNIIPTVTMVVTYATYTLIMKQTLSASVVFSSMAVFDRIRDKLQLSSWAIASIMKGKVSLERVQKFLRETELLDEFDPDASRLNAESASHLNTADNHTIGFKNAVFTWDIPSGNGTPSETFHLQIEGDLSFKEKCVNLIVGPTGAGKTSVLMALLGEMHYSPSSSDSWFNLPRAGGVAYAAQESWVQNETIRENILFGATYDEERYKKVIYQCALTNDIELFEAGDQTEVGEKGLTLSGGQKARVTLARALYSPAKVLLLDDILSALDVHTAQWVVKNCLQGDLIRGRTVLLVTHSVALAGSIAGFFVTVDINGVVKEAGTTLGSVLNSVSDIQEEAQDAEKVLLVDEVEVDHTNAPGLNDAKGADNNANGKLVLDEEIQTGHIAWRSVMLFLRALGGKRPLFFAVFWVVTMLATPASESFSLWFLGLWSNQYEGQPPQEVNVAFYLSTYIALLMITQALYTMNNLHYILGTLRASRFINNTLIGSILTSTFRWLDETPASRIIARCTQDINFIDGEFANNLNKTVYLGFVMVIKLIGPVFFTPSFLVPSIVVALVGMYLGNMYLKAQLSVKREMSNARSPILAHFGATISGLTSIRAYGAQNAFKGKSLLRIDHYTRISKASYDLNRWVQLRFDVIGNGFTAALAAYLLIRRSTSAANAGFSLVQSMEFCQVIIWIVQSYNELEVQSNSLERVQAYLDIDHEPQSTESGRPPAAWPTSGALTVDNLSAKYSANGPQVLQNISFNVNSGERIGIVGRTGSGKSSLTLALLRCILVEGNVLYDGIPVNKINLDALRSSITIIPQIPELLSGTLRHNLDPFAQHDDAFLNDALRDAGLFSLQSEMDEGRLALDSEIASGGGNLSVGQRQIIALARAIVRNSKLLILDEATSAIDHKTDSIIQSTLRTRLASDISVLTVAHRLQNIMDYDKIMVLDAGKIVEYDSPPELLRKEGGIFKFMVDENGDKQGLYTHVPI